MVATTSELTELRIDTGYFDVAYEAVEELIETAEEELKDIAFDTFVATGLSGTVLAPVLARHLDKTFVIIRKPDDTSNHSGKRGVGRLGKRWVFLDDFISSGATRRRVFSQMTELLQDERPWVWNEAKSDYDRPDFLTEHVGTYEYTKGLYTPAVAYMPVSVNL